jgi:two-component system NarL family sensor kinase
VSAPSIALEQRTASITPAEPRAWLRVGWVVAAGGVVFAAALALTLLLTAQGVPSGEYPESWKLGIRLLAIAPLLPLGALLLVRVPRNPIGVILCATSVGVALAITAQAYAVYSHAVDRLPAEAWVGWIGEWASTPMIALVAVAPLLFPTGRLPSPRWRLGLWLGIAATALLGLHGALGSGEELGFLGNPISNGRVLHDVGDAASLGWFLMVPATGFGIAALLVRRRTADPETLEQLRLLLRATVVVTFAFLACLVGSFLTPGAFDFGATLFWLSLAFLAGTMAVAILRFRLYGLDVYVNRALVYAGLTLALGGLYVGAVLGFSRMLGADVNLGVALPATALVAVAFNPLRDRLQRSVNRLLHGRRDEPYAAISTLGRRLGEAMAPGEVLPAMVETIAESLRLPYVAVELAGARGPAASYGTPAAGIALRLPLLHGGERVGALILGARAHGEALDGADRRLLEDFARHAGAAASAVALSTEVQRSRERLVSAREEERRRLSGDLHDGLGPTLAGAILTIEAARRLLARDAAGVDELLDRVAATIESTVADVRRLVYGLRPPALDQLGLVGALRRQASTLGTVVCEVDAPEPMPALPAAVEVAAFRIAQEALTNVARHAEARNAAVLITIGDALGLEIRDDGAGFRPDRPAGVGLTSMRERAVELGGAFVIDSRTGHGTVVTVRLPLERSPAR